MHRVVITGAGAYSPVGSSWDEVEATLRAGKNRIQPMEAWDKYDGLNTRLGGPVTNFEIPEHYTRKKIRSMGRVSLMATSASENALLDAGLLGDPVLTSGSVGVAYGSSSGSTDAISDFGNMLLNTTLDGITATTYIRMMGHTTAVNIGVFFGLTGRIINSSVACASGSQGIGYAFEAIRDDATSTRNDAPTMTPQPFDADRDGLVIGEGACTLILERRDRALARGAKIYAEVLGYATNSDGAHVTQPTSVTMQRVMEMALEDADLDADAIGYVCAHGTATDRGDIAESQATHGVFGDDMPISALKSYTGHTLGACGALESWVAIEMMNHGWFMPTINLNKVDERCASLDYITGAGRELDVEYVMNNNFAFGGINTSLIFKRHD
jgi:3-oxoacyl-[acyl-carrier-protein] synthase II